MLPVQELTEHLDKERGVSAQGPARPPTSVGLRSAALPHVSGGVSSVKVDGAPRNG